MRIAAIEDKLSKLNITEEELRTYEKVAAALGGQAAAQPGISAAQPGISAGGCINECAIARGITPRVTRSSRRCPSHHRSQVCL